MNAESTLKHSKQTITRESILFLSSPFRNVISGVHPTFGQGYQTMNISNGSIIMRFTKNVHLITFKPQKPLMDSFELS